MWPFCGFRVCTGPHPGQNRSARELLPQPVPDGRPRASPGFCLSSGKTWRHNLSTLIPGDPQGDWTPVTQWLPAYSTPRIGFFSVFPSPLPCPLVLPGVPDPLLSICFWGTHSKAGRVILGSHCEVWGAALCIALYGYLGGAVGRKCSLMRVEIIEKGVSVLVCWGVRKRLRKETGR